MTSSWISVTHYLFIPDYLNKYYNHTCIPDDCENGEDYNGCNITRCSQTLFAEFTKTKQWNRIGDTHCAEATHDSYDLTDGGEDD